MRDSQAGACPTLLESLMIALGAIWIGFPLPPTYIIFLELISLPIARSIMKVPVAAASRFIGPARESTTRRTESKSITDAGDSIDVNWQYRYYPGGMES